jgi:UDP-N-acetyl-D-mannosaminuronic acid dehydrogenase
VCEALGLDSREVIRAANWEYPRNDIKLPGAGVGGGCLPKDSSMLIDAMKKAGLKPRIMAAAKDINENMPEKILERVEEFHEKHAISPKESKILIMGFAFKGRPEVNDTRHSPGGHLCRMLNERGYAVFGFDPAVTREQIATYGAQVCQTAEEGFSGATCVIAMNDNPRWGQLDLSNLSTLLTNSSLVIDGWDVLERGQIEKESVYFWRLGDGREAEGT